VRHPLAASSVWEWVVNVEDVGRPAPWAMITHAPLEKVEGRPVTMLSFLPSHSRLLFSKETVSDPGKRAPSVYEAKASKTLAIHPFWHRSKENMTTNTLQEVPAVPV